MSKHSQIEKNLLRLTRSRVIARAFRGWRVDRVIKSDEYVSCELCSARFLLGAFVQHEKLSSEISVGGECLRHLLAGGFLTTEAYRSNRKILQIQIMNHYGHERRVVKYSDWFRWMGDNIVGSDLEQEWIHVAYTGMSKTIASMRRLIEFHDDNRPYPSEALFHPETYKAYRDVIPHMMTLNEYRCFDSERDPALERKAIDRLKRRARADFEEGVIYPHSDVLDAWNRMSKLEQRAAVAVYASQESGRLETSRDEVARVFQPLRRISNPVPGMFFWTPKGGLGFIEPDDEYLHLAGQAWMVLSGEYKEVDYRYCASLQCMSQDAVREIERIAFELTFSY